MQKVEVVFGGKTIEVETGRIARQADGAVVVRQGDNMILVTAVSEKNAREGLDFFPLTVNYQEKRYSSGRIPGGFKKREGMPGDHETLISRLIDRPLRPLFPDGYIHETQVIATVMSSDAETPADVLSIFGAACALHISDIPFGGPLGACRIGRIDGEFVLNPTFEQIRQSDMDIVLAATREAILMIEAGASEVPEEEMLDAITYGHEQIRLQLDAQDELRALVGDNAKRDFDAFRVPDEVLTDVRNTFADRIRAALNTGAKQETEAALADVKASIKEHYVATLGEEVYEARAREYKTAFSQLERDIMRQAVLDSGKRVDGRGTRDIRPITIETGVLPRAHGSALFTRGETQALVSVTLGTGSDEQIMESLEGEFRSPFLFHYNFPPYCVGEAGFLRAPGRREIGHGNLARRGVEPTLPHAEEFPYTIRIVSEITESNGSSSMASTCGASLAMMDAGVPVSDGVSGIAMGLVLEGERYAIISDILGIEDHLGDMDFKVAGTPRGITALQMDIKVEGITREIMSTAIRQANEGREHILGKMNAAIAAPRDAMSPYAPRIETIKVPVDRIRDIIGPGGKMIRSIVDETGAKIDIEDDGTCRIASADGASLEAARRIIEGLIEVPEVGKVYSGKIKKITEFGAFVEFLPGTEGLLHISQVAHRRIAAVTDVLNEGEEVKVQLLEIDQRTGKFKLSRKALLEAPEGSEGGTEDGPRRGRSRS